MNTPPLTPEWLTIEQASQYTQVGERTIRALVDEKKLEATFFSPRNLRVKRSSIDAYAKKNTVK
ncbi:helix-turn-helix domain-containing protein [Corynebacterium diphtheriae]|nr:helix-turn-helix domain-containing protein [Corynebacterium diphtheriae]CAB0947478.1 helix-turn-helix domain-containing protein [Corynebacterium diphtheriae]